METTRLFASEPLVLNDLQEKRFHDVTFLCGSDRISTSQLLLAAASPFFKAIFTDDFLEDPVVTLVDYGPEDIKAMLAIVCTGVHVSKTEREYLSVRSLCDDLQICYDNDVTQNIKMELPFEVESDDEPAAPDPDELDDSVGPDPDEPVGPDPDEPVGPDPDEPVGPDPDELDEPVGPDPDELDDSVGRDLDELENPVGPNPEELEDPVESDKQVQQIKVEVGSDGNSDPDEQVDPDDPLSINKFDVDDSDDNDYIPENEEVNVGTVQTPTKRKRKHNRTCKHCNKTILGEWKYLNHLKTHIGDEAMKCSVCHYVLKTQPIMAYHKRLHEPKYDEKDHPCTVCEKKFKTSSGLKRHANIHTEERPFVCDYCGKGFRNRSILQQHTGNHLRKYKCHICAKSYPRRYQLREHLLMHSGERGFSCDDCGKAFGNASLLRVHRYCVHTGDRFFCSICERRFRNRDACRKHIMTHSPFTPYSCGECKRLFKSSAAAFEHRRWHHPDGAKIVYRPTAELNEFVAKTIRKIEKEEKESV